MPLPLYLLAVAVFAMGTSEFMLSGLVPDIAAGLEVSVGNAGLLTSAFAVGMVAIEDKLGVALSEEDLLSCDTVGDLEAAIHAKVPAAHLDS